jgi:hypothetical protein
MRFLRSKRGDSLDLLLDTMCNAFGGIVLIAILITLLTRETRRQFDERSSDLDRELVERQIASLQSDIKEANEYLARQASSVSVDPALAARLDEAKTSLQTAKEKNEEAWNAWQKAAAKAGANDPEVDRLVTQKASLASRLARLTTEGRALKDKANRLGERLEALRRERSDIVENKSEYLRLPKEQPERSGNVFFLLKNNEVFPLLVEEGGDLEINDYSLQWRKLDSESVEVTPLFGKGASPAAVASALGATLQLMNREGKYAALDVDSKSAQAYRALRKELLRFRVPFGWSHDETPKQRFGPNGTKPPPL